MRGAAATEKGGERTEERHEDTRWLERMELGEGRAPKTESVGVEERE